MTLTDSHQPLVVRPPRIHRPEIDGLRTVAALLVASYHIWFQRVSGGVDVFFVVSGFLIATSLVGQIERTGRVSAARFFSNLARRLLPIAILVLVVTIAGVWLFTPESLRQRAFDEALASALYAENWYLAVNAVDYLNQNDPQTPFQHFWAMSIQGQFYLVWFVIFFVTARIARRRRVSFRRIVFVVIAVLSAASLAYSIVFTREVQAFAYFSTFTRLWEFGFGALLALTIDRIRLSRFVAEALSWIGLVGLVSCGIVLAVGSQFPGYAALWPVLSAVFVLVGTSPTNGQRPSASVFLSAGPLVTMGTISYGIYLWHWPLLVFYRQLNPGQTSIGPVAGVIIIALAIGLAAAGHRLLEVPIRSAKTLPRDPRALRQNRRIVVAWLALAALSIGSTVAMRAQSAAAAAQVESAFDADQDCFGVNALLAGVEACESAEAPADGLVPARARLLSDTGGAYQCYMGAGVTEVQSCQYGSTESDSLKVALVGNSHAAMVLPGLLDQLPGLNWQLHTFVGNGCVWGVIPQLTPPETPGCSARRDAVGAALAAGDFDVILMTSGRGAAALPASVVAGVSATWQRQIAAGAQIIVIEDNPRLPDDVVGCIVAATDAQLVEGSCDVPREVALVTPDPLLRAADRTDEVAVIETSDFYCTTVTCPAAIGGVIVYRDQHHLTATYARSVTPRLLERILPVIRGQ